MKNLNIENRSQIKRVLLKNNFDLIINCAAIEISKNLLMI